MTTADKRARAHALVDDLFGPTDHAADRAVEVINAHAAALAWVRDATGTYPAPQIVTARLNDAADRLRSGDDSRNPETVLIQAAAEAVAAYRSTAAA